MRWLRPLLAFTWMDMLGINFEDGSYGIGHSTSKMSIFLRQELGETRKAGWSFQTHFMSNLVDHKVNIVDDFLWENFQEHTHVDQLWASFCDKSRGKPGEQVKALRHMTCPPLSMRFYHCCYFDEELTINHADSFLMRITRLISQINSKPHDCAFE